MKKLRYKISIVVCIVLFFSATGLAGANSDTLIVKGNVTNIHNQPLDSVKIKVTTGALTDHYWVLTGTFSLRIPISLADEDISLEFSKDGYRSHTISHSIPANARLEDMHIRLYPGYRILLKGRVRVGNVPLEDVNVTIKHGDRVYNQQTLDCYYDNENYWNCLFLGMFKADITTRNPEDSVQLFFSKAGYDPLLKALKFSEYAGDLLDIKLTYAGQIPDFPRHNLNLKLLPPLKPLHIGSDYNGWFLGLSYLQHMSSVGFWRRLSVGAEVSLTTTEYTDEFVLLPDEQKARIDSFYIDAYAGPVIQFWIIEPQMRKFSTYLGSSFGMSFQSGDFVYQPYLGTRYFLDLSKAISLEVRYLSHQIETTEFQGNMTGSATPVSNKTIDEKIMVNLGVQVIF